MSTETRELPDRLNANLLESLLNEVREGVVISDTNNRIIRVNEAFTRITGYSSEDAIGQDPAFLSAGHQPDDVFHDMWHAIENSGRWYGEVWNRNKDGGFYTLWVSLSTLRDSEGNIEGYIGIFHTANKFQDTSEVAYHQASHDALTGLANEHRLLERMEQAIQVCDRDRLSGAILCIDLDNFNRLNDIFGYPAGDTFLIEIGRRLCDAVRDTDTVARIGADRFIVLLSLVHDRLSVELIAESILGRISMPCDINDKDVRINASIGISLFPDMGASAGTIIDLACGAMREAKGREGNSYQYHPRVLESLLENAGQNDFPSE